MYPKVSKFIVRAILLSFVLFVFLYFKLGAISVNTHSNPFNPAHLSQAQEQRTEILTEENGCPPLEKVTDSGYANDFPLGFTIRNQTDADKLKKCHTFKGFLNIDSANVSLPIIIDGPIRIIGSLNMRLKHAPFNSLTMKTLAHVDGDIVLIQLGIGRVEPLSYFTVLNFPVLRSVTNAFTIMGFTSLQTINILALEDVGLFTIFTMRALHTLNAPKLHRTGSMHLYTLPSLKQLSFDVGLNGTVRSLSILGTGLTRIENLLLDEIGLLSIWDNKDLTTVILSSVTSITSLKVTDNSKDSVLDLPKLSQVTDEMVISGLCKINIPLLQQIGELDVGAHAVQERISGDEPPSCQNCLPTYLSVFSAPTLNSIQGDLTFDTSPGLWNINLPVLKSVGNIEIMHTGAVDVMNGIKMPKLQRAKNVRILGSKPHCEVFDDLKDRSVIMGDYYCHINKNTRWTYMFWP
ncbi:hypothetical protein B7463_g9391, partial [Scytalidium lignicola]